MTHATKAIYGLTMMDTVRIRLVNKLLKHGWLADVSEIRSPTMVESCTMKQTFKHRGNPP